MKKIGIWLATLFLALGLALYPAGPAAADPSDVDRQTPGKVSAVDDFDATVTELTKYVVTDSDGRSRFDEERAMKEGASKDVIAAGIEFDALAAAYEAEAGDGTQGPASRLSFPVWGNWCGPGHGGGQPKDTLDRLCMRHDKCYASRGYFDCYCDAVLKAEIRRYSSRMGTRERAVAAAITVVFSVTPCVP